MGRVLRVVVAVIVASSAACSGGAGEPTTGPTSTTGATSTTMPPTTAPAVTTSTYPPAAPGTYPGDLQWSDRRRFFLVTVPDGYDPGVPAPLIISLHSERATAAFHADGTGLAAAGAARGYLVVHPQAEGAEHAWQPESGGDDMVFLDLLLRQLRTNFNVAETFLVGMSQGAGLAHRYACEGEVVAAVVAIAGRFLDAEPCAPGTPVSVLAVHSEFDDVAPIGGIESLLPPIADWVAAWVDRDGCGPAEIATTSQGTVTSWGECDAGTAVVFYLLGSGGHSWPATIFRTDGSVVDTAGLILDFLDDRRGARPGSP